MRPSRVLVVDDTPQNVKLLAGLLAAKGYEVASAASGEQALELIAAEAPDLVLLDVMMPGLSGYEVCRRIRDNAATALLPVVLVTALDAQQERVKGIEAGADDFLSKPINQPELFARVRSLLRVKELQDQRLARLKSFFSPQLAEAIAAGKGDELLRTHRREITVQFFDLRGFTAFTDEAEPEEVMELLRGFHAALGRLVLEHQGTLERFAGDAVMVFFNDPLPVERPAEHAVRTALAMRDAFAPIAEHWKKRGGFEIGLGIGIAQGYATLGAIGFEGRQDYAAIGNVTNLAARLCGEAKAGQLLADRKTMAALEGAFQFEAVGPLALKGFDKPVPAFALKA
ncbi:MAG TPA: response regulator [Burkholderiales bacterium]|nr:response regulator [Burkholderiales bacterium]